MMRAAACLAFLLLGPWAGAGEAPTPPVGAAVPPPAPQGAAQAAPVPAEVREEVLGVLGRLREAYAAEELRAILALHDPATAGFDQYRMDVTGLLASANYFDLRFDDVAVRPWANGVAEAEALMTLRFRRAQARDDSAARRSVILGFGRDPEGRLRISSVRNAPEPLLPRENPVTPVHYLLRARLHPEAGRLDVEGELTFRNSSAGPVSTFWAVLDGFAEDVEISLPDLPAPQVEIRRGAQLFVEVSLREPLPPGGGSVLRFRHRIVHAHATPTFRIAPDATYLLEAAAWFPVLRYAADVEEPLFDFDLRAVAPPGMTVVTSGELASVREVEGGREFAWFSVDPAGEVPLLAAPLERTEQPGEPFRILLYAQPGGRFPGAATTLGWVRRAYDFLAARLGPPPRTDVTVVALRRPGIYGGPHLFVVSEEWLRAGARPDPAFLRFLGHQAAHAWFVQGVRAVGPGAEFLREAPSELCAAWLLRDVWGEEAWRGRIQEAREAWVSLLGGDQALGVMTDQVPAYQEIAREKGLLVLNSLAHAIGEPALQSGLRGYLAARPRGPAAVYDLQQALEPLSPRVAGFFADWVYARKVADPALESVEAVPPARAGGEWLARVTVRNRGEGRLLVPVLVRGEDGSGEAEVELGPGEEAVAEIALPARPARVQLDPEGVTLQVNVANDWWPGPPTFVRPGLESVRPAPDVLERSRRGPTRPEPKIPQSP